MLTLIPPPTERPEFQDDDTSYEEDGKSCMGDVAMGTRSYLASTDMESMKRKCIFCTKHIVKINNEVVCITYITFLGHNS